MSSTGNPVVNPYIFFGGRCEEAIEFYRKALGAQVMMIARFKESPDQSMTPPGFIEKIMHARIGIGQTTIMMSDGQCHGTPTFQGISLSLTVSNEADAKRFFAGLSDGGKVQMPVAKTFFSPAFGMLSDRFGVGWMVYVAAPGGATS